MSTIRPTAIKGIVSADPFGMILKSPRAPIKEPIITPAIMTANSFLNGRLFMRISPAKLKFIELTSIRL